MPNLCSGSSQITGVIMTGSSHSNSRARRQQKNQSKSEQNQADHAQISAKDNDRPKKNIKLFLVE